MVDLSEGTVFIDSESGHLLGTPIVLVGDPGSGFCARIGRLGCCRDAGVAGAEPRIRDHYRYSSAEGTLAPYWSKTSFIRRP